MSAVVTEAGDVISVETASHIALEIAGDQCSVIMQDKLELGTGADKFEILQPPGPPGEPGEASTVINGGFF